MSHIKREGNLFRILNYNMKTKILFFVPFLLLLILNTSTSAQPNSVKLTRENDLPVYYSSITAAYSAIPGSVTTNYLIEILNSYDGTDPSETYPIQLTDKGMLGSPYTITIRPELGNNNLVIKRPLGGIGTVVQFNGGDNIILDGRPGGISTSENNYMSIVEPPPGNTLNTRVVELLNGANNNTVQFTKISAFAKLEGSRTIFIGAGSAANNYNTITDCIISGGHRSITVAGLNTTQFNLGTVIKNNSIKNFYLGAILASQYQSRTTMLRNRIFNEGYAYQGGNVIIDQTFIDGDTLNIVENTIDINTPNAPSSVVGILCVFKGNKNILRNNITLKADTTMGFNGIGVSTDGSVDLKDNIINTISGISPHILAVTLVSTGGGAGKRFVVSGNKILNLNSPLYTEIIALRISNDSGSITDVYNNFISVTNDNSFASYIKGILIEPNPLRNYATINVYFNTIRIGGNQIGANTETVLSSGIHLNDSSTGTTFTQKNNLVINDRKGSLPNALHVSFYNQRTPSIFNIDHNVYYGTYSNKAVHWVDQTFLNSDIAGYKNFLSSVNQEQHSTFTSASFVSNSDLHLSDFSLTDASLLGIPIVNITTDIDSAVRSTIKPTIGADEGLANSLAEICNNGSTSIISNLSGVTYQWQVDTGTGFINIIDDEHYTGTNSLSLTISAAPSTWYGYKYRCMVDASYSSTIKLRFVSYWSGAADAAWENTLNWSCGTLPDENTDVIIDAGNCFLNTNTQCRSVTVRSNASFIITTGNHLITHQ